MAITPQLAEAISIPVVASGGLAGIEDVEALLKLEHTGIVGAISGRALYDGRLEAEQVLALDGVS